MAIGRSEDRDNPWDPVVLRHHGSVWGPIRATHLGQRSRRPHHKGRTYDRNRPEQSRCRHLASRGPSTYGSRPSGERGGASTDLSEWFWAQRQQSCRRFGVSTAPRPAAVCRFDICTA